MAVLPDADRVKVWASFMDELSAARERVGALTKADLRAAVNAVDDWIDANSAAFNSAIPQPARAELTNQQKLSLFLRVLRRRVKGE